MTEFKIWFKVDYKTVLQYDSVLNEKVLYAYTHVLIHREKDEKIWNKMCKDAVCMWTLL